MWRTEGSFQADSIHSGYGSPRSARDNAPAISPVEPNNWATNGMIIIDHTTNKIVNITDKLDQSGYTHGALHLIGPFKNHKGLLLVLMAKEYPLDLDFQENVPGQGTDVRAAFSLF